MGDTKKPPCKYCGGPEGECIELRGGCLPERVCKKRPTYQQLWKENKYHWEQSKTSDHQCYLYRTRIEELEKALLLIGDHAVVDWDDSVVGEVDAVVKKVPETYAEWARGLMDKAKRFSILEKRIERLQKDKDLHWEFAEWLTDDIGGSWKRFLFETKEGKQ